MFANVGNRGVWLGTPAVEDIPLVTTGTDGAGGGDGNETEAPASACKSSSAGLGLTLLTGLS